MAKHHIIPRAWFNRSGIKIDDSPSNIVILAHKDHFTAHYKLFKYLESTSDKDMAFRMLFPLIGMLSFKNNPAICNESIDLSDEEIKEESIRYQEAMEKFCEFQSNTAWITNGKRNMRIFEGQAVPAGWKKSFRADKVRTMSITDGAVVKYVSPTEKIPDGWHRGTLPTFDVETDAWITDGLRTKKIKIGQAVPAGWRYGSSVNAGKRCATDGKSNVFLRAGENPPDGWRFGMTRPNAKYDRTTGMVHIFKGQESKMVAGENLQEWIDAGWRRGRRCGNREQWLFNLKKAKNGFIFVTDGNSKLRIRKEELLDYYARGWWILNKKKRTGLKQKYGFSLNEISAKYGWKYGKDGFRNVI